MSLTLISTTLSVQNIRGLNGSPSNNLASFPVSLVSRFCTPPKVKFDAFGTSEHEEGKKLSKIFLLYLSVPWEDLMEQIKKICQIHFKTSEKQLFKS